MLCEDKSRRMPPELRRAIVEYLYLRPRASLDEIKGFSTQWLRLEFNEARFVPTSDMISGIRQRVSNQLRLANSDMSSCDVFISQWKSRNPLDSIQIDTICNNDGDKKIIIYGQTAHMRSMSHIYGKYVIGLDSTHRIGVHAIPFYLMMIRDCFGHGQVVGFFMLV